MVLNVVHNLIGRSYLKTYQNTILNWTGWNPMKHSSTVIFHFRLDKVKVSSLNNSPWRNKIIQKNKFWAQLPDHRRFQHPFYSFQVCQLLSHVAWNNIFSLKLQTFRKQTTIMQHLVLFKIFMLKTTCFWFSLWIWHHFLVLHWI